VSESDFYIQFGPNKNHKNHKNHKITKNHKMTRGGYCSHPLTILTVLAKRTLLKKYNEK